MQRDSPSDKPEAFVEEEETSRRNEDSAAVSDAIELRKYTFFENERVAFDEAAAAPSKSDASAYDMASSESITSPGANDLAAIK